MPFDFLQNTVFPNERITFLDERVIGLMGALTDVSVLVDLYEEKEKEDLENDESWTYLTYSALVRTPIIIIVAAWETYIEETLKLIFQNRLENAKTPEDVEKAFNVVAQSWFEKIKNNSADKPKSSDFSMWTGNEWKRLISEKFNEDVAALNTPSVSNIDKLYKRYLEINISEIWTVEGKTRAEIQKELEDLIRVRGSIAHYASDFTKNNSVSIEYVYGASELIFNLVMSIESFLFNFSTGEDLDDEI